MGSRRVVYFVIECQDLSQEAESERHETGQSVILHLPIREVRDALLEGTASFHGRNKSCAR